MIPEEDKTEEANAADDRLDTPDPDDPVQIEEQLAEALREKAQFRAIAQRSQADLANYKRRAAEEVVEARRSASTGLLLKVLSVVDDMERALAHVPESAVAPGWLDGLRLVQRNLSNLLDSEGVTAIEAQGRPFEPWEHDAVLYEETPDCAEGTVVRVIREGYRLRDRVLRPAQVAVAKAPEREPETDSKQEG